MVSLLNDTRQTDCKVWAVGCKNDSCRYFLWSRINFLNLKSQQQFESFKESHMLPFQQHTVGVDGVFLTLCSDTDIDHEIVIFMVSICCSPSDRQRYQR